MDKKTVQDRIDALRREAELALVRYHAINGAIEDCLFWLGEAEKAETAKPVDGEPKAKSPLHLVEKKAESADSSGV